MVAGRGRAGLRARAADDRKARLSSGGSTGLSGGMVWLPNNPLMRADGIPDSHADGLAYLADVVGDIGAPSSPERREMFLTAGYEMINFPDPQGRSTYPVRRLERLLLPNHKGGNEVGRAIEGIPFDAAAAGTWRDKVQPSTLAKSYGGYVVKTNELRSVQYFQPRPARLRGGDARCSCAPVAARLRRTRDPHQRGVFFTIGQMLKVLIDLGDGFSRRSGSTPRWTTSSSRTAASSARASSATARFAEHRGAQGSPVEQGGRLRPQRWTCAAATAATSPTRRSGPSPTRATPARFSRRRCAWARRPTSSTKPGGCLRFSSRTAVPRPRRWVPEDSGPGPSTSTRLAAGSATSPTPTSRSGRQCTPTRRSRAG